MKSSVAFTHFYLSTTDKSLNKSRPHLLEVNLNSKNARVFQSFANKDKFYLALVNMQCRKKGI